MIGTGSQWPVCSPLLLPAAVTLSSRLSELSVQIQEFVHKIAENRHCALQSLDLQLHLGQLKVSALIKGLPDFSIDCVLRYILYIFPILLIN